MFARALLTPLERSFTHAARGHLVGSYPPNVLLNCMPKPCLPCYPLPFPPSSSRFPPPPCQPQPRPVPSQVPTSPSGSTLDAVLKHPSFMNSLLASPQGVHPPAATPQQPPNPPPQDGFLGEDGGVPGEGEEGGEEAWI